MIRRNLRFRAHPFALIPFLLLFACSRETAQTTSFKNAPVILISVDTLRSDHLPAYGYDKVQTPNIDALRRDGILFQRAYSHCPMTLPSHASILTGLLPAEHGVRNNIGYKFDGEKFRTLAKALQSNGYQTGAAVSSYVMRSDTGIDSGFSYYDDSIPIATAGAASEHQRPGTETLKYAKPWIAQHAQSPFFFFFHIYEPHAPYNPTYDLEIAKSDEIVGNLIAHLKALGVYDRALIVFLSDHGEGLWQHGEDQHGVLLYRESLQVPLILKLPQSKRAGETVAKPVQLIDVFPTVLSLLGIEDSKRSLFGEPRAIYSETLYPRIHLGWSDLRSLVDDRFHYIDGPRPELYDIAADPGETNDLVAMERRSSASLREKLKAFPTGDTELGAISDEDAKKLAALGYVGSPQQRSGPLPNPKDVIGDLAPIKDAFRLADSRHFDEAVIAFRALLDRNPNLGDAWSKLGEVLVDAGRYDEAIATYKTAIVRSEHFSPNLALSLGNAYMRSGHPDLAIKHAELAMNLHPREAHELMARAHMSAKRYREAADMARMAIEEGDRQPTTILLFAEVQRAAGDLNGALATIADAERRGNDLEVPHVYGLDYLRGDVLARLDRPSEAIAAYERELKFSPQHLQTWANLAIVYWIEGRRADSERVLNEMVKKNPQSGARLLAKKTRAALRE